MWESIKVNKKKKTVYLLNDEWMSNIIRLYKMWKKHTSHTH